MPTTPAAAPRQDTVVLSAVILPEAQFPTSANAWRFGTLASKVYDLVPAVAAVALIKVDPGGMKPRSWYSRGNRPAASAFGCCSPDEHPVAATASRPAIAATIRLNLLYPESTRTSWRILRRLDAETQ
jgi:hypothetical protein